jgi:hypothetical protein
MHWRSGALDAMQQFSIMSRPCVTVRTSVRGYQLCYTITSPFQSVYLSSHYSCCLDASKVRTTTERSYRLSFVQTTPLYRAKPSTGYTRKFETHKSANP